MQMKSFGALASLCLALWLLPGCATAPRDFSPIMTGPADASFETALAECRVAIASGDTTYFADTQAAGVGVGAAAGLGAGGLVFTSTMGAGAAGAAAASTVAMPVVAVLAGVGYSRHVRNRREQRLRQATAQCLQTHGYEVAGWERAR